MDAKAHWEHVYRTRPDAELSWFQHSPERSLALFRSIQPRPRRVIDVGGGQSPLAAALLAEGVDEVVVLDIAESALERARERAGPAVERISFIAADATDPPDLGQFDLWHDRAVFHFLTDEPDRRRYAAAAARSVPPGAHALIATFAPDAPERCSGLPVHRCDARTIAADFTPAFELLLAEPELHHTPWGKPQPFTYALLRRR